MAVSNSPAQQARFAPRSHRRLVATAAVVAVGFAVGAGSSCTLRRDAQASLHPSASQTESTTEAPGTATDQAASPSNSSAAESLEPERKLEITIGKEKSVAGESTTSASQVTASPEDSAPTGSRTVPLAGGPRPLGGPYQDLRRHTFGSIGEDTGIDVSPDGDSLVFSSTRDSDRPKIYLQEAQSPLVRSITTGPARDLHPEFSPDGQWIAFASDREGNFGIWLVPAHQPTILEQATSGQEDELHPAFSPDGNRITFCRYSPRQGWNLWIKTRDQQTLTEIGPGLFPEWPPTGEWIAFQKSSERGRRWFGIWIVRPDGSDVRQVVSYEDRGAIQPTWFPDGSRIAFTTTSREPQRIDLAGEAVAYVDGRSKGDDVTIVEFEHGRVFQLTRHDGSNWSPAWSLNGRIYFTSDRYQGRNILSLIPPEVEG